MDYSVGRSALLVIGALSAVPATADDWSGDTQVSELVLEADRTVLVKLDGHDQPNPDVCASAKFIVLLPPEIEGGVTAYKEFYATLLAANMTGRQVSVSVEGCTAVGSSTYPILKRLAVSGNREPGQNRDKGSRK